RLSFQDEASGATESTIFDLASLTKVIATTSLMMGLVADGRTRLDGRIADGFSEWRGPDREEGTFQDLLEHAPRLPPRRIDTHPAKWREVAQAIYTTPLESPRRTAAVYRDLGFILLGFLVADCGLEALFSQFERVGERLASREPDVIRHTLTFAPDVRSP